MTTWFTSDIHIGHVNIIAYASRPFVDVPHMNESLVEGWNAQVAPDDRVYILGDLVMGKMDDSLPVAGRLNGQKILIPGNHDRLHPMYRHKKGYEKWDDRYREEAGIDVVKSVQTRVDVGSHRSVLMCHFPYSGDHTGEDDRYVSERPADTGDLLVHGHIHDAWQQNGRQFNVGIDAWGGDLLSEDRLSALLDGDATLFTPRQEWPAVYPEPGRYR